MSFVSLHFWLFACALTLLYFLVPKKIQWAVLLCGSVWFYACSGFWPLLLMLATARVTWVVALRLETASAVGAKASAGAACKEERADVKQSLLSLRKFICAVAILTVGGVWAVLKYANFFVSNFNSLVARIDTGWQIPLAPWVLPLGISFYTFHLIGYAVDVYRGKYPAERNFAKFFAFVSFFPHLLQGPFTRFNQLGASVLAPHRFSWDRLSEGCARILWGLFKKLVVADKLGIAVQLVFANYRDYSGIHVMLAMIGYCVELYADFSGYMDIACGLSHIWGIELPENFRQPYFAKSIEEFWRRWHITLGAWFKDYVFYPVSMGKLGQELGRSARKKWGPRMGKLVPGYFALVFVWTATGLWHGANWTFLVWGYLNLFVIVVSMQLGSFYEKAKKACHIGDGNKAWQLFAIIRTFLLVCFFRFFSSQPTVGTALSALGHAFTNLNLHGMRSLARIFPGMQFGEIFGVLLGGALMFLVDVLREAEVWETVSAKCPLVVRNLVYASLIVLMVLLTGGSSDLTRGFMYANF